MCYNNECDIEIVSSIGGEKSVIGTRGRVIKTPSGVRFEYTLDGDSSTLSINDTQIIQKRCGQNDIVMVFKKGEQTQCAIKNGGFCGEFSLYTVDVSFLSHNDGGITTDRLMLTYKIGEEKIEITFSAKYKNYQGEK